MTESNKQTLIHFGKVALCGLVGIVAIIAAAGVWNGNANGCVDGFYGVVAGLNLVAEGFGVYFLGKHFFKKNENQESK